MPTILEFQHANLKTPICIIKEQVFAYYYSQAHGCVHIIGPGSSMVPVLETVEQVTNKIKGVPSV